MGRGTFSGAASGMAALALLTACASQANLSDSATARASLSSRASVQPAGQAAQGSDTGDTSVTSVQLFDDYTRMLNSGPTHFVSVQQGGFPSLVVLDGVLDLRNDAAEYKSFRDGTNSVDLSIAGVSYMCLAYDKTHHARGYCDSSTNWLRMPSELDAFGTLTQQLLVPTAPTSSATSGILSRRVGAATIRGVHTTGFEVDTTSSRPRRSRSQFVFWVDEHQLVREIQLTEWVTIPGLSNDPSDSPDPSNDGLPPDPTLEADRLQLEQSTPGGLAPPPVPGADEATFTMVAQFSDVGTAPGIKAPPADAIGAVAPGTGNG